MQRKLSVFVLESALFVLERELFGQLLGKVLELWVYEKELCGMGLEFMIWSA